MWRLGAARWLVALFFLFVAYRAASAAAPEVGQHPGSGSAGPAVSPIYSQGDDTASDPKDACQELFLLVPGPEDPCSRHGVDCNSDQAPTRVNLSNINLSGTLSVDWGCPSLRELILSNSSLSGTLPAAWASDSGFSALETLHLDSNIISGSIPPEWAQPGAFPALGELNLQQNPHLGGQLPDFGQREGPPLRHLELWNCDFTGTLPAAWAGLKGLEYLWAANNRLSGSLPLEWSWPSIGTLGLGNNRLSGTLPNWGDGSSMSNLTYLVLINNRLYGAIPSTFIYFESKKLKYAFIADGNPGLCQGGRNPLGSLLTNATTGLPVLSLPYCETTSNVHATTPPDPPALPAPADGPAPPALTSPPPPAQRGFYAKPPTGSNVGAIAGGVVGGVVAAAIVLAVVLLYVARRRRRAERPASDATWGPVPKRGHAFQRLDSPSPLHPPSQVSSPDQHADMAELERVLARDQGPSIRLNLRTALERRGSEPWPKVGWSSAGHEWHIDASRVVVGDGSYIGIENAAGKVLTASLDGSCSIAIRVIALSKDATQADFKRFDKAMRKRCKRPEDCNIVQVLGAFVDWQGIMFVAYELMEGGSLRAHLDMQQQQQQQDSAGSAKYLQWYSRGAGIALCIAKALRYLHARKITHLGVKSSKVLLSEDGSMAKLAESEDRQALVRANSPPAITAWDAPEVWLGQHCTNKADIYSFGVLLWELVTGEVPVRTHERPYVKLRAVRWPMECPHHVMQLIIQCTAADAAARPSAEQLVKQLANGQGS